MCSCHVIFNITFATIFISLSMVHWYDKKGHDEWPDGEKKRERRGRRGSRSMGEMDAGEGDR
jgi:hypothetical protein